MIHPEGVPQARHEGEDDPQGPPLKEHALELRPVAVEVGVGPDRQPDEVEVGPHVGEEEDDDGVLEHIGEGHKSSILLGCCGSSGGVHPQKVSPGRGQPDEDAD